ncbi:unnamed protein product, partial [Ectocarpus sp. 12 AP-2014]
VTCHDNANISRRSPLVLGSAALFKAPWITPPTFPSLGRRNPAHSSIPAFVRMRGQWSNDCGMRLRKCAPTPQSPRFRGQAILCGLTVPLASVPPAPRSQRFRVQPTLSGSHPCLFVRRALLSQH